MGEESPLASVQCKLLVRTDSLPSSSLMVTALESDSSCSAPSRADLAVAAASSVAETLSFTRSSAVAREDSVDASFFSKQIKQLILPTANATNANLSQTVEWTVPGSQSAQSF